MANVVDIILSSKPRKLRFFEYEIFDKTGLEVKLKYSDNTEVVTEDYTLFPTAGKPLYAPYGMRQIRVTHHDDDEGDRSISFNVEVIEINKINILSKPSKLKYNEGETLNLNGLQIEMWDRSTKIRQKVLDSDIESNIPVGTALTPETTFIEVYNKNKPSVKARFDITVNATKKAVDLEISGINPRYLAGNHLYLHDMIV